MLLHLSVVNEFITDLHMSWILCFTISVRDILPLAFFFSDFDR